MAHALTLALALTCAAASPQENKGEWISLFDGKSLAGWKPVTDSGCFKVCDGMIVAGGAPMDHLFYVGPVGNHHFKNFELKVDVMTKPGANSGIFFHTEPKTGALWKGYEAQINATHKDKRKTGGLFAIEDLTETPVGDNEWFEFHIIVKGKRIILKVNGKTTIDYTEPENPQRPERRKGRVLSSGQIALQGHDPGSIVYFKNIRIKLLPD